MSEDRQWKEAKNTKASGCAREHAWVEWRRQDDGAILILVNDGPALRIAAQDGFLAVHENTWSESRESMAACLRLATLVKEAGKLFEAHNKMGDLIRSFRSFAFPSS